MKITDLTIDFVTDSNLPLPTWVEHGAEGTFPDTYAVQSEIKKRWLEERRAQAAATKAKFDAIVASIVEIAGPDAVEVQPGNAWKLSAFGLEVLEVATLKRGDVGVHLCTTGLLFAGKMAAVPFDASAEEHARNMIAASPVTSEQRARMEGRQLPGQSYCFYCMQSASEAGENRHPQTVVRELAATLGFRILDAVPQSLFSGWDFWIEVEEGKTVTLPSYLKVHKWKPTGQV